MSTDYIPAEDSKALPWMQTFSGHISSDPPRYAQSGSDAETIAFVVQEFAKAYALAIDPATRSPMNVASKDIKRAEAEQVLRQYAIQIKYNAGVDDADKVALGIRPPTTDREPIPDPSTSPLLNIIGATPGAQTLRYADSLTPDSAAKPFGCTQLQLYLAVADEPVDDPALTELHGIYTRNPVGVAFSAADDGKIATYFARWATARGVTGPWSLGVSMRIAA